MRMHFFFCIANRFITFFSDCDTSCNIISQSLEKVDALPKIWICNKSVRNAKKNHSRLFVSYTYLYICVMREEGCRIIVGLHSELNETILKLSRKANITKKNNKIYI